MAKSREEVQDIALAHMDRINRNSKGERDRKVPSLKEQLDEAKRVAGLTESEKLKEMEWGDWSRELREWMLSKEVSRRHTFTQRFISWIFARHKADLEKFHREGTTYREMMDWLTEMQMKHINLM